MTQLRTLVAFLVISVACSSALRAESVRAHPVSVTQAYAYVTREAIDVKIDVFLEDLFLFHDLKPNDQDFLEPDIIEVGVEKHRAFLSEKFLIRDLGGEPLRGRIVEVDRGDVPNEGVALGELMAHTLTYRIRYDLPIAPEFMTVSQHFTDAEGLIPAEMNLVIKQENGGEPTTAALKSDEPLTVRFNWDRPPLSAEASEEERAKWEAEQKEETLGITSYSSVYSFLYIDDFEVRHEILIPMLTLEESVLVARDDDEFLDLDEQAAARRQIEAFFRTGNPIEINGIAVTPKVDRCDFFGLDFKDFAKQSESKRVSLASARVGIILTYPLIDEPETVNLLWNRFNNYLWTINMVVFAFDDVSKVTLSRLGSENTFAWKNPGRTKPAPPQPVIADVVVSRPTSLPLVTVICLLICPFVGLLAVLRRIGKQTCVVSLVGLILVGAAGWPLLSVDVPLRSSQSPALTEPEMDEVFAALHENVYRAFDYRNEQAVYDALANSIDGELLERVYLQIRRGLEMQEQGGALSRIESVEILEGDGRLADTAADELSDANAVCLMRYQSRWNVAGTVEHWGHIHARTNQYEAMFEIEAKNGVWKITDIDLLAEKRVSFETSLRSL